MVKFQMGKDGKPALMKEPKAEFIDDKDGKPVGINRFLGRRPIFAFGNSDGDQQMLQYTVAGPGRDLPVLCTIQSANGPTTANHTLGKLDKELDEGTAKGWTIVDIKGDWRVIFPPQK